MALVYNSHKSKMKGHHRYGSVETIKSQRTKGPYGRRLLKNMFTDDGGTNTGPLRNSPKIVRSNETIYCHCFIIDSHDNLNNARYRVVVHAFLCARQYFRTGQTRTSRTWILMIDNIVTLFTKKKKKISPTHHTSV